MLYTATYVPYRVSFVDEEGSDGYKGFELCIDILFMIDIFINFISAVENPDGTYNPRLKPIVKSYMKSWFILDIAASVPT